MVVRVLDEILVLSSAAYCRIRRGENRTMSCAMKVRHTRKLIESGVEVTALRALATFHDFAMLNPLAATPATRAAIRLAAYRLSEALSSAAEKSVAA